MLNQMEPEHDSPKSSDPLSPKIINLRSQAEHMLQNAVLMTEMGMDLKERSMTGEKYVCYLRSLAVRAGKTISALQASGRTFLLLAQKLAISVMAAIDNMPVADQACYNIKLEYERLLAIIEKELADVEDNESLDASVVGHFAHVNIANMAEKIKYLEAKQKMSDNSLLPPSNSTKSVKSDVDEKYPENLSRESLIDLNNIVNLPTVPEDIFTTFSSNKPTRTSSLSSLKSMRKVKLFLQRASSGSDDEDESSEPDEHDFTKLVVSNLLFCLQTTGK